MTWTKTNSLLNVHLGVIMSTVIAVEDWHSSTELARVSGDLQDTENNNNNNNRKQKRQKWAKQW